jgi:DNA-binding PadR family transcriptional regulator
MSNAETALLGLLAERPMHPYQIEKEVENRDMRVWADLSMSSIYKLLRKLETGGFVSSSTKLSVENRARKTYELTAEGIQLLRNRVRAYLSEPELTKSRMDVAISNLAVIPSSEAVDCLQSYKLALMERRNGYQALESFLKHEGCPGYRLAFARRPIQIIEGEMRWVDEYVNELLQQDTE